MEDFISDNETVDMQKEYLRILQAFVDTYDGESLLASVLLGFTAEMIRGSLFDVSQHLEKHNHISQKIIFDIITRVGSDLLGITRSESKELSHKKEAH